VEFRKRQPSDFIID